MPRLTKFDVSTATVNLAFFFSLFPTFFFSPLLWKRQRTATEGVLYTPPTALWAAMLGLAADAVSMTNRNGARYRFHQNEIACVRIFVLFICVVLWHVLRLCLRFVVVGSLDALCNCVRVHREVKNL